MKLTKEMLKDANNNVMTIMENHIMILGGINDRTTANNIANAILDLDRDSERILKEIEEENLLTNK